MSIINNNMEFFKFIFSDFWIFIGFLILFTAFLDFIYYIIKVLVRNSNGKETKKETKKDDRQVL